MPSAWLCWLLVIVLFWAGGCEGGESVNVLRSMLTPEKRQHIHGDNEYVGWMHVSKGDLEKAKEACIKKADWRESIGKIGMKDMVKHLKSDGYSMVLETLKDCNGNPVVWSFGLPRGDTATIRDHTIYLNERIMANCKPEQVPQATVVIDFRSPSFRFPDKAIREGGFDVNSKYYPWWNENDTIFVGVPKTVQQFFELTKPIMPKSLYERFKFAADYADLSRWIDIKQMPSEWGGESMWTKQRLVQFQCAREGTLCST